MDARVYQIGALSVLLGYGMGLLDFDISLARAALILGVATATQWVCSRAVGLRSTEFRSAAISGLSLCLLLRTNVEWVAALGAVVAVSSKFLLRWKDQHVFNPTKFALVVLMIVLPGEAWVSPAQWGNFAFFAFLMLCLGGVVVNRAARWDVTLAFLAFYTAIILARSAWLNEPASIPLHKLQSGGLLLFAFFMISDPKTTPDSRRGRIVFAFAVALGAAWVQFRLFRNNGLLWSLVGCSLAVPLINWLLPGEKYQWQNQTNQNGVSNEITGKNNRIVPRGEPIGVGILRLLRREG